ncbi:hypothetical protein MSM1_05515 [Mycobacterium sp. SM1]|uniref:hypothetical protein n=1 Tax=Mycobacterium sp. SM1 TaxID=2816243 RepID=UPI001BCA7C8E|nr:hypothetical protein [Mycobacterium sp. SM1]MBS4727824.1 hypothetical protein [Mycobacterium sp. SM1]
MRGQGHQIFVNELNRFAADAADPRVAAIARRVAAPLRVSVSGRRGVGRGTVAHALDRAGSRRGIVVTPPSGAADVAVYVIAEVVKPEDRDAIVAARHPVLVVLNKADLTAPPSGRVPDGPIAVARGRCRYFSMLTGAPTEPMAGLLAVAALDDLLDDGLWAALRALARSLYSDTPDPLAAARPAVSAAVWRRLVDTLDAFGITLAVAAVQQGRPDRDVRTLLRHVSGVDAVVEQITALGAEALYLRILDAVAELEALAVTDGRLREFLSSDDTVIARMAAAQRVVGEAGPEAERSDDPVRHLLRAVRWQRYGRAPLSVVHRCCGADIVRGSLRLWSRCDGSPRSSTPVAGGRTGDSP